MIFKTDNTQKMKYSYILFLLVLFISDSSIAQNLYLGQGFSKPQLLSIDKQSGTLDTLINSLSDLYFGRTLFCDTANQHLYFSGGQDFLGRSDYNAENYVCILDGNALGDYSIQDIKGDPDDNYLFLFCDYFDGNDFFHRIYRCDLDGGNIVTLHTTTFIR